MASKRFVYSIIFRCLLYYAVIFLLIHCHPTPPNETQTSQPVSTETDDLSRDQLYSNFKPRPDSPKVVIQVENITKALWDTGFKLMALILERNLPSLVPYAREDGIYKKNNTITLYNGSKITIFVPPYEVISFKNKGRIHYKYQIAAMKLDMGDFSDGLRLPFFDSDGGTFIANYVDHVPKINDVRITHWNIYNDGNVIVHGVEDNLRPYEVMMRREKWEVMW